MGKGAGRDEVGSAQGPTVRDKHFTKTFLRFYSSNNTFHETSKTVDLANTLFSIPPLKCQQAGISVCLGASVDCFCVERSCGADTTRQAASALLPILEPFTPILWPPKYARAN
jgi:hypothetical protein